jgi:TolA-binding protein
MAKQTVQTSRHHPSDVLLQQYVSGALSASNAHQVELHCLSCEACGAALAGLEELLEKGALQSINELPAPRVSSSNGSSPTLNSSAPKKYTWAIAAAIGLLAVGTWFMSQQQEKETAVASNTANIDTLSTPPEVAEEAPSAETPTTTEAAKQPESMPAAKTESETPPNPDPVEPAKAMESQAQPMATANDSEKDELSTETLNAAMQKAPSEQATEIKNVAPAARSAQFEDAIGPASLNNAEIRPRDLRKSNIEQDFKNLNTVKQLLSSGEYLRCEKTLGKILSHGPQSPVFEEARFLQGRLLLHQNKLEEARAIFESIKNAGGKMSKEASTELDKMGR